MGQVQTEAQARRFANKLKNKMKDPKNWKTRVWNNLGWCYSIRRGTVEVYPMHLHDKVTYSALVSDQPGKAGFGLAMWGDEKSEYTDPNQAVDGALERVDQVITRLVVAYAQAKNRPVHFAGAPNDSAGD